MKLWRKLNKGCLLLIATPFIILLGLLLFSEWVWGGSIKPSLDPQYVPTAEYLIQHPQPTLSSMKIQPDPGTTVSGSDTIFMTLVLELDRKGVKQWTRFFLNQQPIARNKIDTPPGNGRYWPPGLMVDSTTFTFKLDNKLTSGLHLFRMQIAATLNESLNPDPKLTYEWAYRVE